MKFVEMNIGELRSASFKLCELLPAGYRPDLVVYLARGGYLIGRDASDYFACPLAELEKHRAEPLKKDAGLLGRLPRWAKHLLRAIELYVRKRRIHQEELDSVGPAALTPRYPWPVSVEHILFVDDSVDSGSSVIAGCKALRTRYPESDIRIAVLNTFVQSAGGVSFDAVLMHDTLLSTPASKDNLCYEEFCRLYENDEYK